MDVAYATEGWGEFYVAVAGAGAALAGLLIVAISVNVAQILANSALPARAYSTVGMLVLIVVTAAAGLIPGQGVGWLGAEVLLFSLIGLGLVGRWAFKALTQVPARPRAENVAALVPGVLQVVPFVVGGGSLILGSGGGLYWIAAGIISVFIVSMINSWVLLIEILR